MRDEDRREPEVFLEFHQPFAEVLADLRIDGAEGFVEQQHAGLGRQGTRDGHPLALAAGELVGKPPLQPAQIQQLEELRHTRRNVEPPPAFDAQSEGDVLEHVHGLEQRVALEDEANVALLHGHVVDALAADKDVALGRHLQAGDHAQDGRLAAPTGTQQRQQLAFLDGEADVLDGVDIAETLADAAQFDAHRGEKSKT